MKRIRLKRISESPDVTMGAFVDCDTGLPICLSLELPWKENKRAESCIPTGIYTVNPYTSKKYPKTFQVMDVEGRTYILIHAGNTVDDTDGCILPGSSFGVYKDKPSVFASKDALNKLKELVDDQSFTLIVE